jgi:DNA-binding CsgD family transcriptional regulator
MSNTIDQFAVINKQYLSIFNTKNQRILLHSGNYKEILGYKVAEEDYKRWSALYWMRDLPLEQSWFLVQMSLFFKKTVQPILKKTKGEMKLDWYIHNFKVHPPGSFVHNIAIKSTALDLQPDGSLLIVLTLMKDVQGFIKENAPWWAQFTINGNQVYSFHQEKKKFLEQPLFSEREIQILKLVNENNDSKQIATLLDLSIHTVEKHRKNLLERSGAKDISALIQICQFGNLI